MRSVLVGFACLVFFAVTLCVAVADSRYEGPPTLKASKVLSPKLLKSPHHAVQEVVQNDGYMNTYRISSRFGDFTARGQLTLEARVHEMSVLAAFEKEFPSSDVASEAVVKTGKGIVTAPVRAVDKAVTTVSDPDKLTKTVSSVPGGVRNLFSSAASAVGSGAKFVYETGKSAVGEGDESTGEKLKQASDYLSDQALNYAGYNRAAKELMQRYSIDPYTDNELVRAEVRRIAGIQTGVGVASRFAPGVPGIPYVGSFNRYVSMAQDVSAYDDPEKLEALNQKIVGIIGQREGLAADWAKAFSKSPAYTPLTRALFLSNLKKLENVEGLGLYVQMASKARDREIGLYYLTTSRQLLDIHTKEDPLRVIVAEDVIPAGLSKRGVLYVPIPVDHLVWTKDVARVLQDFEERTRRDHPVSSSQVRIAGTMSPRCRSELIRLGADQVLDKWGY